MNKTGRKHGNREIEKYDRPVKCRVSYRDSSARHRVITDIELYCVEDGEKVYEAYRILNRGKRHPVATRVKLEYSAR